MMHRVFFLILWLELQIPFITKQTAISLHSFVQQTEISSLIYDPSTFVSNLSINKREFFQRCRTICSLLQNEFIFIKVIDTYT